MLSVSEARSSCTGAVKRGFDRMLQRGNGGRMGREERSLNCKWYLHSTRRKHSTGSERCRLSGLQTPHVVLQKWVDISV